MKDPLIPIYKELFELYNEAEIIESEEMQRESLSGLYDLIFIDAERWKNVLRGIASVVQKNYENEGNSKETKSFKKLAKKAYSAFSHRKEYLSKLDNLLNVWDGLE